MFNLFKRTKPPTPEREICPDCNATGCHDKVYRGFDGWPMELVCKPCMGRGWRVLDKGESAGRMGVPAAACM